MKTQETETFSHIRKIFYWSLITLVTFSLLFGYISTEIQTLVHKKNFNSTHCLENNSDSKLKFFKIKSYEKYRNTAKIYCIFQNRYSNIEVLLNYSNDEWKVVKVDRLNTENKIYWPIYF
jgi:hypothetical protein